MEQTSNRPFVPKNERKNEHNRTTIFGVIQSCKVFLDRQVGIKSNAPRKNLTPSPFQIGARKTLILALLQRETSDPIAHDKLLPAVPEMGTLDKEKKHMQEKTP